MPRLSVPTMRFHCAVALALLALLIGASPARAELFKPQTFTLDNGMAVVLVETHRAPVVAHMVWYRVGAADEEAGQSGVAHFLEHLMFKGTETVPGGEFSEMVARAGGRENAFTGSDYTGYFQVIARDRLEMVMRLEADRMRNLTLTEADVEPERAVVLEERSTRTENHPGSQLGEHMQAALFMNHPYGRPVIGWEHEIRSITRADLLAFYRKWYAPNNAILVIAGDISMAELQPLAEKYYGAIPAAPPVERVVLHEPPHRAARRVILRDPRVRQPSLRRDYLAPSYSQGRAEDAEPLQVFANIIGGDSTSRLYKALVVERKLAVSAGAYYSPNSRGPSQFGIYASPRPGVDIAVLEAALDEELAGILADGVSEDEVTRQKQRILAESVYARDSLMRGARILGSALAIGRSTDHVEAWPDRIAAVNAEQVNAAGRAVIDIRQSVTGLLLPDAAKTEATQ